MKLLEIWDSKIFRQQAGQVSDPYAKSSKYWDDPTKPTPLQAPQQSNIDKAIRRFKYNEEDLPQDIMDALYTHFVRKGEMPYGTMKARTGDPDLWIWDRIGDMNDLEIDTLIDELEHRL